MLALPRQLGPRIYPGYSSDFACSRGKKLVFPLLGQFLELQLSRQMSFCMEKKFLLTTFIKIFRKLWMLLLFLSLASIRVAYYLKSFQPTSSASPLSGCAKVVSQPSTAFLRQPLRCPAPETQLLYHLSWVEDKVISVSCLKACTDMDTTPGSPRCRGRTPGPCAAAKPAAARPGGSCYQVGLVFRPAGFFAFSFCATRRRSRNRFSPTLGGVFALDWKRPHRLHNRGVCSDSGLRPPG